MTIKVFVSPKVNPDKPDLGTGGIGRVIRSQYTYTEGVEFVDTPEEADIAHCHATEIVDHPNIVLSTHGLYWQDYEWPRWAHKANEKIVRALRNANVKAVTTPSEWTAHALRRGTLIDPIVVPHGVDTDEWVPPESHKNYIVWAKNRVDAVCSPDAVNVLAKRLPEQMFVTTFGNEAPNVAVTGRIPYIDCKEMITYAEMYLANVRETGGITVMEAMSAGVPCIGWDFGSNSEIIVHKVNGYLAKPGDYDDLVRGVQYIKEHRDRLSQAARQHIINHFRVQDNIQLYKKAYEKALEPVDGPKVSVVITAYNLDKYLPDAIESVIKQDMKDWELIIVDDNSPDTCGDIGDQYAEKDPRITCIHNTRNAYLAEARNIGLRASCGKYIIPLDADDMLGDGTLRILSQALDNDPDIHIVTGAMELIEPDGKRWVSGWPGDNPSYDFQIKFRNQIPYASMYRRWVWEDTGGYRRRYVSAEDAAFWSRAMSFGAFPAKVTTKPTLIYRNRPDSMSHSIPTPNWTQWFIWSRQEQFRPFAAATHDKGGLFNPVQIYGPPEISVIIPVGPGHEIYLQDSLDSLITQSFQNWEVILINDTGRSWYEDGKLKNPYLAGYPFARIIDSNGTNHGTAWARNRGIEAAQAEYIAFLDADDFFQPLALDVLYMAIKEMDGWVFSDWYDHEGNLKEAKSWNTRAMLDKMLGSSNGIYAKKHLNQIGGFDESIPGWEDYDLALSLLEAGICGSRVIYPAFTYRYYSGINRERDFSNRQTLLQYIKEKHKALYTKDLNMSCGCGGRKSKAVSLLSTGSTDMSIEGMSSGVPLVRMSYIGNDRGKKRARTRIHKTPYQYSATEREFYVYKDDAIELANHAEFEIVPEINKVPVVDDEKLTVDRMVVSRPTIESLNLPERVITILHKGGVEYIDDLKEASNAQILSIKGIGNAILGDIRDALAAYG